VSYLFIPGGIAIAILRYRLWDIDILIRRTLQYSVLTGLLALVYFGTIVILQWILRPLTGQTSSPLVTVFTTLGIAVLFNPLRHRVQEFIDRRFYQKKYDAQLIVEAFAAAAQHETNLDALVDRLVLATQNTLEPESVSLWIRKKKDI
jgi:hypothetical protein